MPKLDENEKRLRKLSQQRWPRPAAKSDLCPGAKYCIACKDLPATKWWPGARYWTLSCACLPNPIVAESHAHGIAEWNKKQWRFA